MAPLKRLRRSRGRQRRGWSSLAGALVSFIHFPRALRELQSRSLPAVCRLSRAALQNFGCAMHLLARRYGAVARRRRALIDSTRPITMASAFMASRATARSVMQLIITRGRLRIAGVNIHVEGTERYRAIWRQTIYSRPMFSKAR